MSIPIMSKTSIKRSFFGLRAPRPRAEPGTALVLVGGSSPIVLWPGSSPTPGEGAFGGYTGAYTVDLSPRPIEISNASVAAKDGLNFLFNFEASYRVSDPVRVVNEQLSDGDALLRNVLLASVRRETKRFAVEEALQAEEQIRVMLDEKKYTEVVPFEISGRNFHLRPDPIAEQHIRALRNQENAFQIKDREESAKYQMLDKRRAFYRTAFESGAMGLLLETLVNNPNEMAMVTQMVMELDSKRTSAMVDTLRMYIEADRLPDRPSRDIAESLMSAVQRQLGVSLPPSAPAPKALSDGPSST